MLQEVLRVKMDGYIGPLTARAARNAYSPVRKYIRRRLRYYQALTVSDPTQLENQGGWRERMISLAMFCAAPDGDGWRTL